MKVRRIRCTQDIAFCNEGQVMIEYGTYPGFFYLESEKEPNGVGICEAVLEKRGIRCFFEEIEPIDFKKTKWFKYAKKDLEGELEAAELSLTVAQNKMKDLLELKEKFK